VRRNRDLIRSLLLEIEASDAVGGLRFDGRFTTTIDDTSSFLTIVAINGREARPELRSRDYHLIQMQLAGLIDFVDHQNGIDFCGGRVRLTPLGHDAAEAIANEHLWTKLRVAAPHEAYAPLKNVASSVAVAGLTKVMGWG
jgi:hypothetical protein